MMRRRTVTRSAMTLMMRRRNVTRSTTTAATTTMTKHPAWSWPAAIVPTSRYYTNKDGLVSLVDAGSLSPFMNLYDCNLKCVMWVVYMLELSPICVLEVMCLCTWCAVHLSDCCVWNWVLLRHLIFACSSLNYWNLLGMIIRSRLCAAIAVLGAAPGAPLGDSSQDLRLRFLHGACRTPWTSQLLILWSFADFAYTCLKVHELHTRFPFMNLVSSSMW